ncbi:MAG: AMP-binding protein, partial [Pirellulaceae bacterium]
MPTPFSVFDSHHLGAGPIPGPSLGLPAAELAFPNCFELQVEKSPDGIALEFEQVALSYRQLNASANQLAHYLNRLGFPAEERIGICMDRSLDAVIAMLGVMKAGLAFVPLDPEFPQERLHYIVEHAGIRRILCHTSYEPLFATAHNQLLVRWEPQHPPGGNLSDANLPLDLPLDSLAYVMFTSGSTGKPKGVQIEHRALSTYCRADIEIYELRPTDRTLQFSTLNFDIAIEEILPPLLVGSTVVVRPRQRAEAAIELSHWIESNHATAIHVATA